jgi:hypothetical protein
VTISVILPLKLHTLLPARLSKLCAINFEFSPDMLLDMQLPLELVFFHVGESQNCSACTLLNIAYCPVLPNRLSKFSTIELASAIYQEIGVFAR